MAMLGGGRCGGRPQHVVTVPLRVRVRWGVERWRAPRGGPSLVVGGGDYDSHPFHVVFRVNTCYTVVVLCCIVI